VVAAQVSTVGRGAGQQTVYASVLDKQGAPVRGLGPSDFVVRENGVEREVTTVSAAVEPLRIAVLADTSRSMEPFINDMREALRSFVRELRGNAEIALFEFGDRSTRLVDYTRDPAALEAGIGRLFSRSAGGSYVLDAIVDASKDFRRRESARPVIVVISAQGPEFSQRFHGNVLEELRASRAALHSLVISRRRLPILNDGIRERELTLSQGATLTGGRRQDLLTSMALEDSLNKLARELKGEYRIGYLRPEGLIPPTRLEVTVRRPELKIYASRVPPGVFRR
jgi:VWFA-related protein